MAKDGKSPVWTALREWAKVKEILSRETFLTVFDLETTGLSPANDRVIEIAAIKYMIGEGFSLSEMDSFQSYVNPERAVTEKITELTGITNEMLSDAPTEAEVFSDMFEFFGEEVLSGHNIERFDIKFMSELYARHGETFEYAGTVDTYRLAKEVIKIDKENGPFNHKLSTLGDYFGVDFSAHSAVEDVRATSKIVQILLSECVRKEEEEEEAKPSSKPIVKPEVLKVSFWEGFRGMSRIYVETSEGTVYYNIRTGDWGGKDVSISELDMGHVESEAWKKALCSSEDEFRKFKGNAA
jgi:DNA polymerase III epsilon subunit family exonuclease